MSSRSAPGLAIERDPTAAAAERWDIMVIGGGIYGTMLALAAARRGYRPLLLERDDFGGATTWNHLRIVHGGLRYLQTLDLARYRASVLERSWLLRHFPDFVAPLPCLMPLYGRGLRRPFPFRVALALDSLLSRRRNRGLLPMRRLPAGKVLDAGETLRRFPAARREGLQGSGQWWDASVDEPQRLLMESLRWACSAGARCLNYVEALELLTVGSRVAGVRARDGLANRELEFRSPVVVNCAGPWSRTVAARLDRDVPSLFRPSLAFNLLLEREPLSADTVAVQPPNGQGTYFLRAWQGRVLAGTFHAARTDFPHQEVPAPPTPEPTEAEVEASLTDLRAAVPALSPIRGGDVRRVHAGYLPAATVGSVELAKRSEIHDHGRKNGPVGLFSVSGVKFTTAHRVAERTLRVIFARSRLRPIQSFRAAVEPPPPRRLPEVADQDAFRTLALEEAAFQAEDLLLRRGTWAEDPDAVERLRPLAEHVIDEFQKARSRPGSERPDPNSK